jgi:3-dehydroquinate dehydratase-1
METKPDPIDARLFAGKPRLVGVVATRADWELVTRGVLLGLDSCELRMDLLAAEQFGESECLTPLPFSKILTIRDPDEGGRPGLSASERVSLFERLLPHVDYIDIELRNFSLYSGVLAAACALGKQLIVSVHDFEKTPSEEQMRRWANETEAQYPEAIFKIAARLTSWEDLVRMGNFLVHPPGLKVAAMGMGTLGKISRLLFAGLGSALVYVSFHKSVAPGQWDFESFRSIFPQVVEGN